MILQYQAEVSVLYKSSKEFEDIFIFNARLGVDILLLLPAEPVGVVGNLDDTAMTLNRVCEAIDRSETTWCRVNTIS